MTCRDEVRLQCWEDHKLYHQSRINQSLHFFSACSFIGSYVLLYLDSVMAALVRWIFAITSRQIGHSFFASCGSFYSSTVQTGLVWLAKLLTDPLQRCQDASPGSDPPACGGEIRSSLP